jgi:outer membrane protein
MRLRQILLSLLLASGVAPSLRAEETAPEGPKPAPERIVTIEEAQERAVAANPNFRNLDETIYQADMAIYQAWSMLLPNLTADGSITRNQRKVAVDFPMPEGPPLSIVIQDLWSKTFGFGVNLTLFNPQSIPIIKLAYDAYERERLKAQIQRNELLFAVTSAYYQAYSMEEMISVAEENLATAEEFLRHAEALMTAGQATEIDITRAKIEMVSAKKALADAKDGKKKAMIALKYLINLDEPFTVEGPGQVRPEERDLGALKSDALDKRVELKEAAVTKIMARRSEVETLTKFLPLFDVTYSWSWASAEGFTGSQVNWMLVFGAKWNLFLGGSRIAEYKIRQSQSRMVDHNLDQIELDIKQQVEQSYLEAEQRKRNVEIADEQVALAEKNHYMISRQFEAGLITSLDVIDAANKLANQRILRVFERLQYDLAILTLKKNLGEYHPLSMP